jgi:hypothetical protein
MLFLLLVALVGGMRLDCSVSMPTKASVQAWFENQPAAELAIRAVDTVLFEPGYRHARELANHWKAYADTFVKDERRAIDLEALVNSPAVTAFLKDPESSLAPVFAVETARLFNEYNNATFKAWRLRTLAGKVVLQKNGGALTGLDISETRREITARFVTVPISSAGFNYSFDAEWDITRLHDFPLTQASSEFLYVQTDAENNLIAVPEGAQLPNSVFQFVSGAKFIAPAYGVHAGMRVLSMRSDDVRLFICYPFAGYLFYAVRGAVVVLVLFALFFALSKIKSARTVADHVLENRSGRWLEQHYSESLTLNERALDLSDKATGLVAQIKERDAAVIAELGGHIQHLTRAIRTESERAMIDSATAPGSKVVAEAPAVKRPLHKKAVYKDPILIEGDHKPAIEVSVELDLPLTDEKELSKEQKVAYVSSLKQRARAKTSQKEFVHDEALDQFDYVPADPMPMPVTPVKPLKDAPDDADLEYVQKFRYTGKTRVLPMAETVSKAQAFHLREDLHAKDLVIGEEE